MSFVIFDENFYLTSYPDVKAAVAAKAFTSGLQHFQLFGLAEGRTLVSPFYNEESYLKTNPDVAAAVQGGAFKSGMQHYVLFGETEGRSGLAFDEKLYLQKYPNVASAVEAGNFSSGLDHFIKAGRAEGLSGDLAFDEQLYLQKYPDVAAAVQAGAFKSGIQHFIQFGKNEGRSGTTFNEDVYLELHADVAVAVQSGSFRSGFQHYAQFGQFEPNRLALFSGTTGNDTITGLGEGSTITGVDIAKVSTGTVRSENSGKGEVDILIGGAGSDLFILGTATSFPGVPQALPQAFYDGGGSNDYAVIKGFEQGKDTIQLAGYQSFFYRNEVVNGSLNISTLNGDLIATVEGVTSLSQLSGNSSTGTFQLG